MRARDNIISIYLFLIIFLLISGSCAKQGAGTLVGGPKDVDPPVILESSPENYCTNFTGQDFEFVFDEYFSLKELNKKLLISPPMEEKPEIKIKGKKLLIHFISPLQPDRTYTLNFGDALVDLNEANPIENFMVIFSTGNEIDSLEIQGRVIDAFTRLPAENVSVMLYSVNKAEGQPSSDSLPYQELPLYLSKTNKEGNYYLRNLAEGDYKLFALLDGNNNYLFDMPTESIAFIDTLVQGRRRKAEGKSKEEETGIKIQDSTLKIQDSLPLGFKGDTGGYYEMETDSTRNPSEFLEDLLLFAESIPKQYISGTERKRAEKIQMIFNQPLDTIDLNLLYNENNNTRDAYRVEWSATKDTLIAWMTDSLLAGRDSLFFTIGYFGYDSLEQKEWMIDTLRFKFKHSAAKQEDTNPMSLKSSVGRIMELGKPMKFTTGLPFKYLDTSLISLYRIHDSLEFPESFNIKMLNNFVQIPGINRDSEANRQLIFEKVFLQDSSYSLHFLPGAFTGFFAEINDSLDMNFKVNTEDKYGVLLLNLENLDEPALLQLLDSKNNPLIERRITGSTTERFPFLKPGKYKFKLILDKNQNGKWDTGRYLKKIQPEPILLFEKEITLKANWEMEETWRLELNNSS